MFLTAVFDCAWLRFYANNDYDRLLFLYIYSCLLALAGGHSYYQTFSVCRFESDGNGESTVPAFSGLDPASAEDLQDLEGCPEDPDDDPDSKLDESDEEEPHFGVAGDID